MKESNIEGLATHDGPESCADAREGAREVLTGVRMGRVLSREIRQFGTPTPLSNAEGNTPHGRNRESVSGPTRSETPRTYGTSTRENQEISRLSRPQNGRERAGKASGHEPATNSLEKSDRLEVPTKRPNKVGQPTAEDVEGRSLAKENTSQQNMCRTQRRESMPSALERVRQAAIKCKGMKFTALMHHVTLDALRGSFRRMRRDAAPGVDGTTVQEYEANLEGNLVDLHNRIHSGAYRAKPSRRVFIPKADGRQRPLGIASLEDKIVQRSVVEVLNAIYENDFQGFSYGFRLGRHQHQALDALATGILRKKVNWILDADIRGFFDALNHEWLLKFLQHRVKDGRILRLIRKWLKAGVIDKEIWSANADGAPQGATISPLLANVYLHYVLDLWVAWWRCHRVRGEVVIVRYADDFIVGFQYRSDADQFLVALRERLAKFNLELHPDKTRLLAFGRYASAWRKQDRMVGSPETFDFLGFTHICGTRKQGGFQLMRRTMRKRMTAKIHDVKEELRRRRHRPIPEQGKWLRGVMLGHFAYYGVPTNNRCLESFRTQVCRTWRRSLKRRSQRHRLNWARMKTLQARWLPSTRIVHPWPQLRFDARIQGRSPVR
jgi:RNA-directed DNA polymerase